MSTFDNLLGPGSASRQLLVYGVGYEIARALLGPVFTQIEYDINSNSPIVELSPPEIADMVVRGFLGEAEAITRAAKFGLDPGRFQLMVDAAGEPPGLVQILEWWRRGFLPWDAGDPNLPSVVTAIRTSRVYNYWTPVIQKAQFTPISPADAVNAVQRNQISLADGRVLAYYAGLGISGLTYPPGADPTQTDAAFQILLDTRGNPPSLGESLELARRGIIEWGTLSPTPTAGTGLDTTFTQAIYEGDIKDKWVPKLAALADYLPPPRTITSLLSKGAITATQAQKLFADVGLSPTLQQAYITSATTAKTNKPKLLSEANILQLLNDKLIDQAQAVTFLEEAGYPADEATMLASTAGAQVAIADLRRNVSKVGTFFVNHKIDRATAAAMLNALGIAATEQDSLLAGWTVDREANIRVLTPAQITAGWEYGLFTEAEALGELGILGYTPFDAWVVLSIKAKQPLPNKPPPGPAGIA